MSKKPGKGQPSEKQMKLLTKVPVNVDSDKELELNVTDDDHMSNRIPESNVKNTNQIVIKNIESEEGDSGNKNMASRPNKSQNSASPTGRNNPQKTATGKFDSEDSKLLINAVPTKTSKSLKLNLNDPDHLKKLIYTKSPKEAAEEYLLSSRHKLTDQGSKPVHQKSVSSIGKNERSYPYGFNTGSSPDKKDKQDDGKVEYDSAYTELAKKLFLEKLHQQHQGRKTVISRTPVYEMLLSPHAAKEIENRKTIASKELQESISARLLKQGEVVNEHSRALAEAYLQKEFEECTFNPKISDKGASKRTVDQFLEDQKKFADLIELKKQKVKDKLSAEQKVTEGTYKPELCKKSLKILEKKKKMSSTEEEKVHARLYKINKNAQQKQMQDIAQNEDANLHDSNASSQFLGQPSRSSHKLVTQGGEIDATFVPNIHQKSKTIKRELKIDTILYNDAMRRQKKTIVFEKKHHQKKHKSTGISDSSKRAYATRFIREFEAVFTDFIQDEKVQKLDFLQLNELLIKLFFLKDAERADLPQSAPERILLHDLWYTLYADKFKGLHRRNLLVFLLAVLGLNFQITKIQKTDSNETSKTNPIEMVESEVKSSKHSSMIEKDKQGDSKSDVIGPPELEDMPQRERRLIGGFDDDENVDFNDDEVKRVQRIYNIWLVNRLGSQDNIGQLNSSKKVEEPTYSPDVNEKSKNIAHLYREKILKGTSELIQQKKFEPPKDGKLTHADLLVLSKKIAKEKSEEFKANIEKEALRECTFHPLTNEYSQRMQTRGSQIDETDEDGEQKRNSGARGKDRAFDLYSLRKVTTDKKDRDAHEIEYEKNCDECTFQPDLTLTKLKKFEGGNDIIMAKNIEKTIQRLRQANEAREQKNLLNQRGLYPQRHEPSLMFSVEGRSKKKQNDKSHNNSTMQKPSVSLHNKWLSKAPTGKAASSTRKPHKNNQHDYGGNDEYDREDLDNDEEKVSGQMDNEGNEHSAIYQGYNEGGEPEDPDSERVPLLFVDVNLGQGMSERIVVYEGDKSEVLAVKFAEEHGLDEVMAGKLKELLDSQIAGLLTRIDEELHSLHSEADKNDQQGNMEGYRYDDDQIHEEEDDD